MCGCGTLANASMVQPRRTERAKVRFGRSAKRTECGAGTLAHNDHGGSVFLRAPMGVIIGEQKANCQAASSSATISPTAFGNGAGPCK